MGFKWLPQTFDLEEYLIRVRARCEELGIKHAVIGISGGKDSTIVAAIMALVLGPDNVTGVLMPYGAQFDLSKSYEAVDGTGINHEKINIVGVVDGFTKAFWKGFSRDITDKAYTNLLPRIRMSILYAYAQSMEQPGVRVIGTTNRSEAYVGWGTKWGDLSADFEPIIDFTVNELYEMGELMEMPHDLLYKVPEDDLTGKSDEENFGFTYEQLDNYILRGSSGDAAVDEKIQHMHQMSRHKFEATPRV